VIITVFNWLCCYVTNKSGNLLKKVRKHFYIKGDFMSKKAYFVISCENDRETILLAFVLEHFLNDVAPENIWYITSRLDSFDLTVEVECTTDEEARLIGKYIENYLNEELACDFDIAHNYIEFDE
jgi:hypothetical protein